jgi:hypothetical protein
MLVASIALSGSWLCYAALRQLIRVQQEQASSKSVD